MYASKLDGFSVRTSRYCVGFAGDPVAHPRFRFSGEFFVRPILKQLADPIL
jgi:hypothetical protein